MIITSMVSKSPQRFKLHPVLLGKTLHEIPCKQYTEVAEEHVRARSDEAWRSWKNPMQPGWTEECCNC
jgi:hypothetical protein